MRKYGYNNGTLSGYGNGTYLPRRVIARVATVSGTW